jgi:hypothetical protein
MVCHLLFFNHRFVTLIQQFWSPDFQFVDMKGNRIMGFTVPQHYASRLWPDEGVVFRTMRSTCPGVQKWCMGPAIARSVINVFQYIR